ncbi:type VI secretion protein, VC_A0114 family [Escherichia coli TA464]|nr:type VI secretion protein, VC_A0114 family [Escherichia coli TA464]
MTCARWRAAARLFCWRCRLRMVTAVISVRASRLKGRCAIVRNGKRCRISTAVTVKIWPLSAMHCPCALPMITIRITSPVRWRVWCGMFRATGRRMRAIFRRYWRLGLVQRLDTLLLQLRAKCQRLMAMRRESNQRMADFAVADVSLFWLLNALNSAEPVLSDFLRYPAVHPELVWRELARLAGALLTFSLEHNVSAVPPYVHESPSIVFPPLFSLLSELLEASLPSRVIALDLASLPGNRWKADLHDPRLREEADFYLSVRSSLPAHQVLHQLPLVCKIGAPDDVTLLINVALNGVPLVPLTSVPAALPLRLENQYFALDMHSDAAKSMLESGCCMIYAPGTMGDLKPELFAVLRT